MINIKAKSVNTVQGTMGNLQGQWPLDKRRVWIGRGDQVLDKEDTDNYAFSLGELSPAVSRIHACLVLSPAFFPQPLPFPSFMLKLGPQWAVLQPTLLFQIWQFARPAKRILLKDNQSKTGVFKKIIKGEVHNGMEIVLGDCRPLFFHHQEIHDSVEQANNRVEYLREQGYEILNHSPGWKTQSFWIMSLKHQKFILLNYPSRAVIGRSSGCSLTILEKSVSRKHATLQYKDDKWYLMDGDGVNVSSNGVWQRVKKIWVSFRDQEKGMASGETTVKVGDVLLNFVIQEDFSTLSLSGVCSFNKGSTDYSLNSLLQKWVLQDPTLTSRWSKDEEK